MILVMLQHPAKLSFKSVLVPDMPTMTWHAASPVLAAPSFNEGVQETNSNQRKLTQTFKACSCASGTGQILCLAQQAWHPKGAAGVVHKPLHPQSLGRISPNITYCQILDSWLLT